MEQRLAAAEEKAKRDGTSVEMAKLDAKLESLQARLSKAKAVSAELLDTSLIKTLTRDLDETSTRKKQILAEGQKRRLKAGGERRRNEAREAELQ